MRGRKARPSGDYKGRGKGFRRIETKFRGIKNRTEQNKRK
jgi:hypothetical protein